MSAHIRATAIAVLLLSLTGCTKPAPHPTLEPPAAPSRQEVPWGDYDPTVKDRIDHLEDTGNCTSLQTEFDTAADNSNSTLERTGHGNGNLMQYIDEALRLAGCYS